MRRIDRYLTSRVPRHRAGYRLLQQIAKAALISMLFFFASLCSSTLASTGDGLPPGCCRFVSAADMGSLIADFSDFRSTGRSRAGSSAIQPLVSVVPVQPVIGVMLMPSRRHWNFDYRVNSDRVGIAPANSVAVNSLAGFGLEASMLQSLLQPQSWIQFELPLETRAKLLILQRAFVAEAKELISANLLQTTAVPLPILAIRRIERIIW